jgi:hypothetical protein
LQSMFVRVRRVRRASILLLGALLLVGIAPVIAQSPDKTIQQATLQVWPEYDDPGVLVIFSGDLSDSVTTPAEVAFPLPATARNIQATSIDAEGRLMNETWKIVDGKLTYTLPGKSFHIEYYLDRPPSGEQRDLAYTFEMPYAISALEIRAQQPARATDFSLTPQPDSSPVSNDGLTYSVARKSNLKAGEKLDLGIRYRKPDQGLTSASRLAATAASPVEIAPAASQSQPLPSWLPWVLIAAGLLALAALAAYWIWRTRSIMPAPEPRGAGTGKAGREEGVAYCTRCGSPFRPGDRFCAKCGAPR